MHKGEGELDTVRDNLKDNINQARLTPELLITDKIFEVNKIRETLNKSIVSNMSKKSKSQNRDSVDLDSQIETLRKKAQAAKHHDSHYHGKGAH